MSNNYDEIYKSLSLENIAVIFYEHIKCIGRGGGDCDSCRLNDIKIEGHSVGCLKLKNIGMQKIADILYVAAKELKEEKDGKNNR